MGKAIVERVQCRGCGAEFSGVPKSGFAGMPTFRCPDCSRAVFHPLTRGWRVFWWVLAVLTVTTGVWANSTLHEGYSWIPKGIGLVAFVALCWDVAVRHRIDRARVSRADRADADVAVVTVAAAPAYVAALTVVITLALTASVLGALAVAGLNNGYSFRVVDQEAREATTQASFDGTFDLIQSSDAICGGGDDYQDCVTLHVAMYNSLCVTGAWSISSGLSLSPSAAETCQRLDTFIEDTKGRLANCGYGCTTRADETGRWGWYYLRPNAVSVTVTADDALPEVTHLEHCLFSLGPVQLGNCPD